jgi:glycosyltransferase involved in cell wall biosynthesis
MNIKRLYIDLSMQGPQMTGVQVYAINLAKRLESEFCCEVIAPDYLGSHFRNVAPCPAPFSIRGNTQLSRNLLSPRWKSVHFGPDSLIYAPHMKGFYFQDNQIITIHDLIYHYYPTRNFVENGFNRHLLPRLLRRLRAVFTVSETSRDDICRFYGLSREQVFIVPNGIDLDFWRPSGKDLQGEPYLLVVSANRPYKNTVELLERHELWSADYRLKIVSSKARYGHVIRERVSALGLQQRIDFIDNIAEAELIVLYQQSSAVVCPSLMEGFGRPALEAMATGRPVILSDILVHKESFEEAAIFITPGKIDSWAAAFEALKDRRHIEDRIARGLQIASQYSWEECGTRLVKVLQQVEPGLSALKRPTRSNSLAWSRRHKPEASTSLLSVGERARSSV